MENIILSQTKLGVLENCCRCFWMENTPTVKLSRPRGLFSSVPIYIDSLMKKEADAIRSTEDYHTITLNTDTALIKKLRDQRTANLTDDESNITIRGALDDLAADFSPIDFKSKGGEVPEGYAKKYYQLQADCYAGIVFALTGEFSGKAYYLFYIPTATGFESHVQTLETSLERVKEVCAQARLILDMKDMPLPGHKCQYCNYIETYEDLFQEDL